ncbi:MAG: DUF2905 domain-containing protein [Nitrospiraceae bacterium]|nr:DUF2905 domain-containing protein [Nitrospiraceae bacterium]
MQDIGKFLLFTGVIIIVAGLFFLLAGKVHGIGRLPGDILVKRKNFTFYFPLATSILISLALTLIMWLIGKR